MKPIRPEDIGAAKRRGKYLRYYGKWLIALKDRSAAQSVPEFSRQQYKIRKYAKLMFKTNEYATI